MKKNLVLGFMVILFVFVAGCSNNNQYQDAAIKAYVDNANQLIKQKSLSVDIKGDITAPKSIMNKEELKVTLDSNLNIDLKNILLAGNFNIKDEKEKNNQKFAMYIDDKYVYFKIEDKWFKSKLTTDKNVFNFSGNNKMKTEDVKETFKNTKNLKFDKVNKDNTPGYTISYEISLEQILKSVEDLEKSGVNTNEIKGLFKDLNMNVKIFVPEKATGYIETTILLNIDAAGLKLNVGPMNIIVKGNEKEVTIPKEAKKAIETQPFDSSLMPGMGV